MQGYRDSTAYDFERFTEKKPNIVRLPQQEPQRRPQSRARIRMQERARRRKLAAKVLACATAVLMLVGFRIFGAIQQSEITAEITAAQTSHRPSQEREHPAGRWNWPAPSPTPI